MYDFEKKLLSEKILDLGKCPKQKTCTFTFMRFLVGHFPKSKIVFESSFYTKSYIITILKKIWERFVFKNGASKNVFPIVFFKCYLANVGSLFWRKKFWNS